MKLITMRIGNAWLKLSVIYRDIQIYILKKLIEILEFRDSLKAYLELNKAGLRIGRWEDDDLPRDYVRYRFFWKDKLIREIPDIVRVHDAWKTVANGHIETLWEPNPFFNKEYHHLMTQLTKEDNAALTIDEWRKLISNVVGAMQIPIDKLYPEEKEKE